jgi:hypothetical protein
VETKIEGFNKLKIQIKKLDDKMTRREVLKIQRKLATPLVRAYRDALPQSNRTTQRFGSTYPPGNLKKSVSKETVPGRKVGGNPQIVVRPSTKGKKGGYYRHMVVAKGTEIGSTRRGSRKGINTVVSDARDRIYGSRESTLTAKYEKQVTKFVQKQIDKLSKS